MGKQKERQYTTTRKDSSLAGSAFELRLGGDRERELLVNT